MLMTFEPVFETQQRPLLVAGPCSAESEAQVLEVAKALKTVGIHLFRAGIWKPRTRPNSFEGVGYEGLGWLKRVREEVQLPVTTEVAKGKHVDAVLEHGIDVLWLGARTTVNPFSVQEIADALQGVDVPVMVKNPLNADIQLWIGAIERIYKAGVRRIAAVHRGFYKYGEKRYRNIPYWQIPIELKRQFPDLQLICDHSHICGIPVLLQQTAQRALDLNYDGLMTEVHPNPPAALSDSRQQITPVEYDQMVRSLVVRAPGTEDSLFWRELDHIRRQIDEIDDEVFQLFSERMKLAEQIGIHKRNRNISIYQPERWSRIRERILSKGTSLNLAKEFLSAVIDAVHQESIQHQGEVMNRPMDPGHKASSGELKSVKSENSPK
ncbi:MAG: 3-deoxy-7-phosphoheptulonate synthase [Saprospirales bacterium]|nr:3-deoxy-7-phosphoheptulonate synthase [Saprospirales bacterium]